MGESDDEFVDRIRKSIARSDRRRRATALVYLALFVAVVALVLWGVELVRQFGPILPGIGLGFWIGIVIGAKLGLLMMTALHGILKELWGVGRSERLLVQYHDAVRAAGVSTPCEKQL